MKTHALVKYSAIAAIPAVAVIASQQMVESGVAMSASFQNMQFLETSNVRNRDVESPVILEVPRTIHYSQDAQTWTHGMDKRFESLAIKEAMSEISPEETAELEDLTRQRRQLKYARSSEEVLWEYKQRKLTSNLVEAVEDYVTFHDFTHS